MPTKQTTPATKTQGLTLEKARAMFESGIDEHGKPDWKPIQDYYHPDVRFQDPLQKLQSREAFIHMAETFAARCHDFSVSIDASAQTGRFIFLQWTMRYRFGSKRAPLLSTEGTTKLELNDSGQVIVHRDYFDLWGDTIRCTPLAPLYDRLMKKLG